jgi:hypothetical protein
LSSGTMDVVDKPKGELLALFALLAIYCSSKPNTSSMHFVFLVQYLPPSCILHDFLAHPSQPVNLVRAQNGPPGPNAMLERKLNMSDLSATKQKQGLIRLRSYGLEPCFIPLSQVPTIPRNFPSLQTTSCKYWKKKTTGCLLKNHRENKDLYLLRTSS